LKIENSKLIIQKTSL